MANNQIVLNNEMSVKDLAKQLKGSYGHSRAQRTASALALLDAFKAGKVDALGRTITNRGAIESSPVNLSSVSAPSFIYPTNIIPDTYLKLRDAGLNVERVGYEDSATTAPVEKEIKLVSKSVGSPQLKQNVNYFGKKDPTVLAFQRAANGWTSITGTHKLAEDGLIGPETKAAYKRATGLDYTEGHNSKALDIMKAYVDVSNAADIENEGDLSNLYTGNDYFLLKRNNGTAFPVTRWK